LRSIIKADRRSQSLQVFVEGAQLLDAPSNCHSLSFNQPLQVGAGLRTTCDGDQDVP
jgi:hypothetical protein